MNFLPEDYQAPKNANQNYMKLQQGENRIRILTKPIIGWEAWSADNKPIRFRLDEKYTKDAKHFWAFVVWNVIDQRIQIYQVTQATIRNAIEQLTKDNDWGSPFGYDIKIIKKGEKMDTEYTVNPVPHKEVSPDVIKAFKERPVNLDALFTSEDPFALHYDIYDKLMSESDDVKLLDIDNEKINDSQFIELSELLQGCSDATQSGFAKFLNDAHKIDSLNKLEAKDFNKIKEMLQVRYKENQKEALEKEMADVKGKI